MSDVFDDLQTSAREQGPTAVLDRLAEALREQRQHHHLFDALLMRKKLDLGLPLDKPTSFDDVPDPLKDDFEKTYIASAREVGELLLADNQIGQAWLYFRTIREPEKIKAAIEALDPRTDAQEEIVEIALYHGVAPVQGVRMLLQTHGVCSTITALDQQFMRLEPAARSATAATLVRRLYDDLSFTLQQEVERKQGLAAPGQSLRELMAGRDWLFADGNYHIDVSHLHSVVRFARSLETEAPELPLAIQLAEYGSRLAQQYQYAGDPPFEEFYPAHIQYLKAVANQNREAALKYFHDRLPEDPYQADAQLIALVNVDLLVRVGRAEEALPIAFKYLAEAGEQVGFSLLDLCRKTGRFELLCESARNKGDLLQFTLGLLQKPASA